MRTTPFLAALLLGAAPALAGIEWESDFARAQQRALAEEKLIFIDIYADW